MQLKGGFGLCRLFLRAIESPSEDHENDEKKAAWVRGAYRSKNPRPCKGALVDVSDRFHRSFPGSCPPKNTNERGDGSVQKPHTSFILARNESFSWRRTSNRYQLSLIHPALESRSRQPATPPYHSASHLSRNPQ